MHKFFSVLLVTSFTTHLFSIEPEKSEAAPTALQKSAFQPFSGKVVGNKVRLRNKPSFDSAIIQELKPGDLFAITGETEDFYQVVPPKGSKAYIYRKYAIDNMIDGTKVNVRLTPDTDGAVVAQLNTGDKIEGKISGADGKWLEIEMPSSARYYVAKDYIENIGGPEIYYKREKRAFAIKQTLEKAPTQLQEELAKQIDQMQIEPLMADLKQIVADSKDFPQEALKAKELLDKLQGAYQEKMARTVDSQGAGAKIETVKFVEVNIPSTSIPQMVAWEPQEGELFETWRQSQTRQVTKEDFYQAQQDEATSLGGRIEPYIHEVKNRPGDFLLVSTFNQVPVAYLYSTKVDLNQYVGREVNLVAVKRPNRNFAFPAYMVLSVE